MTLFYNLLFNFNAFLTNAYLLCINRIVLNKYFISSTVARHSVGITWAVLAGLFFEGTWSMG